MTLTYGPRSSGVAFSILFLSTVDAFLTLHLVGGGAVEVNPFMGYWLGHGPLAFIAIKYFITCLGLSLMLLFKDSFLFRTAIQVKFFLPVFAGVFSLVVLWELFLVFQI